MKTLMKFAVAASAIILVLGSAAHADVLENIKKFGRCALQLPWEVRNILSLTAR